MATKARQQYFADENSLQKQRREFSIADDIQQKIDSIEEGAQVNVIETVKVNGTPLIPDANKAVNVEVPEVIDNLYTVDSDNALSAKQGKILYDYIQNIASRGRFLSNWNSATGLPMTNPSESPYPYKSGDYFVVSNVAASGGTNYRPDGSSYIIGQASTVVETEDVSVSDFYFYDGTNWLLLSNSGKQIAIDSSLSTTSTNPVENRVITNALNNKQDILTAGNHIDITSNVVSTTGLQEELTAGNNITIGDECTTESDMKGPCPSGFHIPTKGEFDGLKSIMDGMSMTGDDWRIKLHMPLAGERYYDATLKYQGNTGYYWSTTNYALSFISYCNIASTSVTTRGAYPRSMAISIRPFKNEFMSPTSSWTVIQGTLGGAGIFWDQVGGLISITSDGITGYTIADKNCGATTVYNDGDTLSQANMGNYYQWGNNYGFPSTGTISNTSSTKVNASNYGPGNYYYSSTFITTGKNENWSTVQNDNLRGGVTQSTWQDCIHNVISATDTTYTAGTGISIDANNVISSTITPGQTYTAGNGIDIDSNNEISVDTSVVATQTDLQDKQGLLTAGDNITIEDVCTTESDMQGPAPDGFHVPLGSEWQGVNTIMTSLSLTTGDSWRINLHMPFAGYRRSANAVRENQGSAGFFWASSPYDIYAQSIRLESSNVNMSNAAYRIRVYSIRCFKNSYVTPDSSWTVIQGVLGSAGIFWNQSEGIISITDGSIGYTIMDKNLGATTVYNDGDTLTQANMGNMYQWGNNYGFPSTGTITNTSSTQVDASGYGPGNYYESDIFITGSGDWSSVKNDNLRGGQTQSTFQDCIYNVISATDTTYTAGTGIDIDSNNEISNTLPGAIVSATAPSSPTEGMVWYDTTNDVLKTYDGTNWNIVGDDAANINTKTFFLTGTTGATNIATAQDAVSRYLSGKNPLLMYNNKCYTMVNYYRNVQEASPYIFATSLEGETTSVLQLIVLDGTSTVTDIYESTTINYSSATRTFLMGAGTGLQTQRVAQKVLDWYLLNNAENYNNKFNPIIISTDSLGSGQYTYHLTGVDTGVLIFTSLILTDEAPQDYYVERITINYANDTVTSLQRNEYWLGQYRAGSGITIDSTNHTISNTLPGAIVSAVAPSSPTEGMLWYDTANDVLKTYDGTNWNEVGSGTADVNTKTFFLTGTTGENNINTVKSAIAYYEEGKNPILFYRDESDSTKYGAYLLKQVAHNIEVQGDVSYLFTRIGQRHGSNGWVGDDNLDVYKAGDYVEVVRMVEGKIYTIAGEPESAVNQDIYGVKTFYSAPVVPSKSTSAGNNPTTIATEAQVYLKQDKLTAGTGIAIDSNNQISNTLPGAVVSGTAPFNPSQGDMWYDTTEDTLNTYDGEEWNGVGGGGGGGDVLVSDQPNNILTSGMKIWAGTESDYSSLSSHDSNTLYLTV